MSTIDELKQSLLGFYIEAAELSRIFGRQRE